MEITLLQCFYTQGIMQDVQLLVMPQGFIAQCPDLNRSKSVCPALYVVTRMVPMLVFVQNVSVRLELTRNGCQHKPNQMEP